jgi:hypothetical protein
MSEPEKYVMLHPLTKERVTGVLVNAKVICPVTHFVKQNRVANFRCSLSELENNSEMIYKNHVEVFEFEEEVIQEDEYQFVTDSKRVCKESEAIYMTEEEYKLYLSVSGV